MPIENIACFRRVVVVGAGGHGRVVMDALLASGGAGRLCFADDAASLQGTRVLGIEVAGSASQVLRFGDGAHVGIGDNRTRAGIVSTMMASQLVTVVHPRSVVADSARLANGVFVAAGGIVAPLACLGVAVIVNHGAVVDHDCQVGDFSHVAPMACLGGGVSLGRGVLVGAGACVLPGVRVGDAAVVGAGAVVARDVLAGAVVIGVPARERGGNFQMGKIDG